MFLGLAWVVVAGHRPWYTTGTEICWECQVAFESIFNEYNVDLALFGTVESIMLDPQTVHDILTLHRMFRSCS
jgi:hypothetical protein